MIQNANDVLNAKTSELVAFYNERAERPVTKFADRKTAERRVIELLRAAPTAPTAPVAHAFSVNTRGKMSAAQQRTWADITIRSKRCERSGVLVDGQEFRSVRAAFVEFGLPINEHIKFRMQLKEQIKMVAYEHSWEIIPLNY